MGFCALSFILVFFAKHIELRKDSATSHGLSQGDEMNVQDTVDE